MKIVRRPRVSTEFDKMMRSNDPVKLLKMMKETGVIFRVVPELCHLYRVKDHTKRKELGANAPLPTLWDLTMQRLGEVVGSEKDTVEARFAALFSQFHRVRIPYSEVKNGKEANSGKKNRRGRGRRAVVGIALRRLMYDYDFIRKVAALLPPVEGEDEEPVIKERGNKKKKKKKVPGVDRNGTPNAKRHSLRRRRKKDDGE